MKKRTIKVCALVDPMGSTQETPEEEYKYIKDIIFDLLDAEGYGFSFESEVRTSDLPNKPIDVYIFDFGGLMPGAQGFIDFQYRSLVEQIENKPDTLFILWTAFSYRYYEELIENEFPESKHPNVLVRDMLAKWEDSLIAWIKIG